MYEQCWACTLYVGATNYFPTLGKSTPSQGEPATEHNQAYEANKQSGRYGEAEPADKQDPRYTMGIIERNVQDCQQDSSNNIELTQNTVYGLSLTIH